jgi:hypothetical protein
LEDLRAQTPRTRHSCPLATAGKGKREEGTEGREDDRKGGGERMDG